MNRLLGLALLATSLAATSAVARNRDAYILCSGGRNVSTLISSGINWPADFKDSCSRFDGNFLWVRRDGRDYIVRDRDFLDRSTALFGPVKQLEPEQRRIAAEEAKLDEEADRLEDREDDSPAARDRLREIHRRQREVGDREREIDRREEALEREAERALWRMVDRAISSGVAVRDR
jgi:hypothetical protein